MPPSVAQDPPRPPRARHDGRPRAGAGPRRAPAGPRRAPRCRARVRRARRRRGAARPGSGGFAQSACTSATSAAARSTEVAWSSDPDLERPEPRMRPRVPPDPGVVDAGRGDRRLPVRHRRQPRRRAAAGQPTQPGEPRREGAGLLACEVRRVRRELEQRRQPRPDPVERAEAGIEALHPDVNVEAADELALRDRTQLPDHLHVPGLVDDPLLLGDRERMRARGCDDESLALRALGDEPAEPAQLVQRCSRALADRRVRLDQAREELGLQPLLRQQPLHPRRERE